MMSTQRSTSESRGPVGHALDRVRPGATTGIGSLPHRSLTAAVKFSLSAFELPLLPTLPRRSPAERSVAQCVMGITGVARGPYGSIAIDPAQLSPDAEVRTDLEQPHLESFRESLHAAAEVGVSGPLKWQFMGPLSVGLRLIRAGARPSVAFEVARRAVETHCADIAAEVAKVLPDVDQLVVLDEPYMAGVRERGFPVRVDSLIDTLSSAMASIQQFADVGVHCCQADDLPLVLAAGPQLVSLHVSDDLLRVARPLVDHLDAGGWVAWGCTPTTGPIALHPRRSWQAVSRLWASLCEQGASDSRIAQQTLFTPTCGLRTLTADLAMQVVEQLNALSALFRSEHLSEVR